MIPSFGLSKIIGLMQKACFRCLVLSFNYQSFSAPRQEVINVKQLIKPSMQPRNTQEQSHSVLICQYPHVKRTRQYDIGFRNKEPSFDFRGAGQKKRVFVSFGTTKGEIRVKKGDFRGDLEGEWGDLGLSHPTQPHLGPMSQIKPFFLTAPLMVQLFQRILQFRFV